MKFIRLFTIGVLITTLIGCSHPIIISPNVADIRPQHAPVSKKTVGYFLAEQLRSQQVETPGGGGDSITYFPYRDMEPALFKMLGNVFGEVIRVGAPNDTIELSKRNISYVITPRIVTNSSTTDNGLWAPTDFSVELTCEIVEANGQSVATVTVVGKGHHDPHSILASQDGSVAARRAALAAVMKMQDALHASPAFSK